MRRWHTLGLKLTAAKRAIEMVTVTAEQASAGSVTVVNFRIPGAPGM